MRKSIWNYAANHVIVVLSKKAREEWKKAVEKAGLICGEKQLEVYR